MKMAGQRRCLSWVWRGVLLGVAAGCAGGGTTRPEGEDFSVWEADIRAFEKAAAEHPEPKNAVVFVGSSSIRLWSTLKDDMCPIPVIQRGFGGSTLGAVAHYAKRVVNVHKPRAVVVFAGSNDVTPERALAPEELLQRYRRFVATVRADLPDVPIYYVAITPSPSRWTVWTVAKRANELIERDSLSVDRLYAIDFTRQLLAPNGEPDPKFYQADGLHMSEAGYGIWRREIRLRLLRDLPEFARIICPSCGHSSQILRTLRRSSS